MMRIIDKNFYFIYLLLSCTVILLFILIIKISQLDRDIVHSKSYWQSSFFQKEKELLNLIDTYSTSLKSLHQNQYFYEYIIDNKYDKLIKNIFLDTKKSLPHLFQVRYINKNGYEKIRVEGNTISLYKNEAKSEITTINKLQNKANKKYFNQFLKLSPGEIGYSIINLNKDNGVVTLPKEPTLRIGMAMYGNTEKPQGVLIYNVSLRYFFLNLGQFTQYKFMLTDKMGNFLVHYDKKYGLLGDHSYYTLQDEFPQEYRKILDKDKYETDIIYSRTIRDLTNTQDIKMILTFYTIKENNLFDWLKKDLILAISLCSFLLLPFIQYVVFCQKKEKIENNNDC